MSDSTYPLYLSIVVPVYNEEKIIHETLRRLTAYIQLRGFGAEILVADDGSKDKTAEIVRTFINENKNVEIHLLSAPANRGKGHAVRRGFLAAKGQYILLTDADLSAPIKELDKLVWMLEYGYDIAIGSRALRGHDCDIQQSFKRYLSGRIFNFFVRFFVFNGIRDTQCGFKCFRNDVAHILFSELKMDGFCFDVEMLYLARQKKYRIKEVPVMWRQGKDSKVNLWRDSTRMLMDLTRIRTIHR